MTDAPIVTVFITHHLDENRPYLGACLRALSRTHGVPWEAIVLADSETCPEVPDGMTLVHDLALNTATKKIHRGIAMAHRESRYFLVLSDDVVVSHKMLAGLVYGLNGMKAIVNPMCNGDNGGQFVADLPFPCNTTLEDVPQERLEEVMALEPGLRVLIQRPYVCFYCTLIPREVWEKVGQLDERLENRHNDQDFCYRAARLGIPSFINLGVFALHFGSRTLSKTAPESVRDEASRVFREKWRSA